MKKLFLFALFCFFISCSKNTFSKFDYNRSENPWIDAFKDQVFFTSLRESYKSDSIFKLIEKKDAFNPYDGLSLEAIQRIRILGIQLVAKMPPPAMCENCKGDKNYYMAICLHYYKSRELDSIAKSEFEKFNMQTESDN